MLLWRQFSGDGLGFLRGKVSQRELKSNQAGKGLGQWFAVKDCPFLQSPPTARSSQGVWRSSVTPLPLPSAGIPSLPLRCDLGRDQPLAPVWAGEFSPLSPWEAPGLRCPCECCVWQCGVSSAWPARLPFVRCCFSDPVLCQAGHALLQSRDCFTKMFFWSSA